MCNYVLHENSRPKNDLNAEYCALNLLNALKEKKLWISVAESFTSGRVSAEIVKIPGASAVFYEGIVAYSNQSKNARLNVSESTLKLYGAVSPQCCAEMSQGLISTGKCDFAISTTGIAGPASDDTKKPVGLCYLGFSTKNFTEVFEYNLKGNREDITSVAVAESLYIANKLIYEGKI